MRLVDRTRPGRRTVPVAVLLIATTACSSSPPPEDVPLCRVGQLKARRVDGEGATGHQADRLMVWSLTSSDCLIPSHVRLELLDRSGVVVSTSGGPPFM